MTQTITLLRPDDWHVHLREGNMLRAVLPYTAARFARAIVMPNLKQPVTTTTRARAYHGEIIKALASESDFTPLMTLYLTDTTDPEDLEEGFVQGVVTAAKLYPAHATTNSEHGVSDVNKIHPVLERMQRIGMPLLVHGEVTDKEIDIFDREAVFIDRILIPLRRNFPKLKIVFEHITTESAARYVEENGHSGLLAATITPHHLVINRNALFAGGIRPHYYCLPVAKREKHRLALVKAATGGGKMFFLGTDTAPHSDTAKEAPCGCAGIFCAPNALEVYAQCFDDEGCIDQLEAFASLNGPAFYGLAPNTTTTTLQKTDKVSEIKPILTEDGHKITPFVPPSALRWKQL